MVAQPLRKLLTLAILFSVRTATTLLHRLFRGPFKAEFWQNVENCGRLATVEDKLQFYDDILQKYIYGGSKSVIRIWIQSGWIRIFLLDPDP
jgi:hypothetical protein